MPRLTELRRRGRSPIFEPFDGRADDALGAPLELVKNKADSKDMPNTEVHGHDPERLGEYLFRSSGSVGKHTRPKSCGPPGPSRSAGDSEAARTEERGVSTCSTLSRQARARTLSASCDTLKSSPIPAMPVGSLYWDFLDHNFPRVCDAALEPYSICIGRTKKFLRCKSPSRCGQSASGAIKLIRAVPTIGKLEEIAEYLLCKRDHQDQKRAIAERWLEQFTASHKSPESVSQDDSGIRGTPETRIDDTVTPLTTPGLSSHSQAAPTEEQPSPTVARQAKVTIGQFNRPGVYKSHGASRFYEEGSSGSGHGSGHAGGVGHHDFSFRHVGESRSSDGTFVRYFGPGSSEQSEREILSRTQLHPQKEDSAFTVDSNAPAGAPKLPTQSLVNETQTGPDTSSTTGEADGIASPDLREILSIGGRHCICRNTTKPGQCARRISKEKWTQAERILRDLANYQLPGEAKAHLSGLEELAKIVLCYQHQKCAAKKVSHWESMIAVSLGCPELDSRANSPSAPEASVSTIASQREGVETTGRQPNDTNVQYERRSSYISTDVDTRFVEMDTQHPEIGQFEKFHTEDKKKMISIQSTLLKALTPRELQGGYIYIYWYPGNFGHLKIGITKRSIDVRLNEWTRTCGRKPKLIYPETSEKAQWAPHIYRIEALVKAELRHCRKKSHKCGKCKRQHTEWFEVDREHAIAVVKKWSSWMAQHPYEKTVEYGQDFKGRGGPWRLKNEFESEIANISHVPDTATESVPKNQKTRKSLRPPTVDSARNTGPAVPPRRSARLAERQRKAAAAAAASSTPSEAAPGGRPPPEHDPETAGPNPYLFPSDSVIFKQTRAMAPADSKGAQAESETTSTTVLTTSRQRRRPLLRSSRI